MAGVVKTTSPISRRRTSRIRCRLVVLDGGFVDEHHRNVVFDRIHTLARRALEGGAVLDQRDRCFTVGTRENLEQFRVHCHARDYMTPVRFLWNNSRMKLVVLAAVFSLSIPLAAEQARGSRPQPATTTSPEKIAEAYNQFLLGHRLDDKDDEAGAIAAYKRAMELDPNAADIPAELAGVYLRQNKAQEAMGAAEQALKIAPANREANRVMGTVYAAFAEAARENTRGRGNAARADDNMAKAIQHLEVAVDKSGGEADPNVRATLARLYVHAGAFDKAIPLLTDLVN